MILGHDNSHSRVTEETVIPKALGGSVQYEKGVGPRRALAFSRMGVKTVHDLLRYFPEWHLHVSQLGSLQAASTQTETLAIQILGCEEQRRSGRHMMKVLMQDALPHVSLHALCHWTVFNRPYLKREFIPGRYIVCRGRVEKSIWGLQLSVEGDGKFEFLEEEHIAALKNGEMVSVYHATQLLPQGVLQALLTEASRKYASFMPDLLPAGLLKKMDMMPVGDAFRAIHAPKNLDDLQAARVRLVFEELFLLQIFLAERRRRQQEHHKGRSYRVHGPFLEQFKSDLPFRLTGAQRKAVGEIIEDLAKPVPMNRLLQGDVGSGKTVVAAHAILAVVESGYQAVVMAPTEILAAQHGKTIGAWLEPHHVKMAVLTSGLSSKERSAMASGLSSGDLQVVVGTHALLEDRVMFRHLGLIVIDERHKFGVRQREELQRKGEHADCLMMTATPFPRALVLTLYGDTDLSMLDEMPPGRSPVKTRWVHEKGRKEVYAFIRERVQAGEQVFMVYPTIDSKTTRSGRTAVAMTQELSDSVFPEFRLALLHGRLSSREKEDLMRQFKDHQVDILIATSVIEVGIDISRATVIVIEQAERFGLAQLHQLRGRVGRGKQQAHCFLLTSWNVSPEARDRLQALEQTHDGFVIAERDLEIRGPGDLMGIRQHGAADAGWLDVKRDTELLEEARKWAQGLVTLDPGLQSLDHRYLSWMMRRRFEADGNLLQVS